MRIPVETPTGYPRMLEVVKTMPNAGEPMLSLRMEEGAAASYTVVLTPAQTAALLAAIRVLMKGLI